MFNALMVKQLAQYRDGQTNEKNIEQFRPQRRAKSETHLN